MPVVIKRDGCRSNFDGERIRQAVLHAAQAVGEGDQAYAAQVAAAAPLSVRAIKKLVYQGLDSSLDTHLDGLAAQLAVVRTSADHKEALAAFREKRAPSFTGS